MKTSGSWIVYWGFLPCPLSKIVSHMTQSEKPGLGSIDQLKSKVPHLPPPYLIKPEGWIKMSIQVYSWVFFFLRVCSWLVAYTGSTKTCVQLIFSKQRRNTIWNWGHFTGETGQTMNNTTTYANLWVWSRGSLCLDHIKTGLWDHLINYYPSLVTK